jgi:hypothetical protein
MLLRPMRPYLDTVPLHSREHRVVMAHADGSEAITETGGRRPVSTIYPAPRKVWTAGLGIIVAVALSAVLASTASAGVPVNSVPPVIKGEAFEGRILQDFPPGTWEGSPTRLDIQWLRCDATGNNCQAIEGSFDQQSYTLTHADAGSTIRAQETASNAEGSGAPVESAATAVVQAAGTATLDVPFSISAERSKAGEDVVSVTNHEAACVRFYFQSYFKGMPDSFYVWEVEAGKAASFEAPISDEGESSQMQFFHCGEETGQPPLQIVSFVFARGYPEHTIEPEPKPEKKSEPPSGSTTPGGSSPSGQTSGTTSGGSAVTISSAQLVALLTRQLALSGKAARIGALLKHGGLSLPFTAPEAGTLAVQWYQVPVGAKLAKRSKAKPVLVASGRLTFSGAGAGKVKMRLTAAGRRMLKQVKRVNLTARGTFVLTGELPTSVTVRLRVGR